ncbi:MAG: hypothetical protein DWQ11_18765 [Proteobacteria bacterium]|nr:MAG: hypothetical protein DWQ11_18765 [Pseudomonadota bacterium]
MVAVASAAVLSATVSYQNGRRQEKQTKKSMAQAQANADKQASQAEQDLNAANMKTPDTAAMMSSAMLSGKAGAAGTMLTGPQGVNRNKLELQRSTLLGQ